MKERFIVCWFLLINSLYLLSMAVDHCQLRPSFVFEVSLSFHLLFLLSPSFQKHCAVSGGTLFSHAVQTRPHKRGVEKNTADLRRCWEPDQGSRERFVHWINDRMSVACSSLILRVTAMCIHLHIILMGPWGLISQSKEGLSAKQKDIWSRKTQCIGTFRSELTKHWEKIFNKEFNYILHQVFFSCLTSVVSTIQIWSKIFDYKNYPNLSVPASMEIILDALFRSAINQSLWRPFKMASFVHLYNRSVARVATILNS